MISQVMSNKIAACIAKFYLLQLNEEVSFSIIDDIDFLHQVLIKYGKSMEFITIVTAIKHK